MGRRATWTLALLTLAIGLASLAAAIVQAGTAVNQYIPDPDLAIRTLLALAALALLGGLYYAILGERKGDRTLSDKPHEPSYRIKGEGVVSFNQQGGQTAREIHNYGPLPPSEELVAAEAEKVRRTQLLAKLRQLYILSHDGISSAMLAGLEPLPKDWVEAQLKARGETWRQDEYS